jgi:hypothetical protein
MYAVEFETTIDDGIVHVPEKYKELQKSKGHYSGRRINRTISHAAKTIPPRGYCRQNKYRGQYLFVSSRIGLEFAKMIILDTHIWLWWIND